MVRFLLHGNNDRYDCLSINTGDVFFADFNLDKESRRKLINLGYEQTMRYFKEFLPKKKEKILEVYSKLSKYLKNSKKGLKQKNVEETQWWLGDIFTELFINKEYVDPIISEKIIDLRNIISNNISNFLFFYTSFKNASMLEKKFEELITIIDTKIAESKLYLTKIKPVKIEELAEQSV